MIPGQAQQFFEAAAAQAGASGYEIERSLRFNSADTAHLSRTMGTFTDINVGTISFWLKRSALGAGVIAAGWTGLTSYSGSIQFDSTTNALQVGIGGAAAYLFKTNALLRDVSAWYHVVVAWDRSASAADKVKVWINGVAQTSSDTGYQSWTSGDCQIWASNTSNRIGRGDGDRYDNLLNGCLAEYHYVDGQALDESNFGEFDNNNNWNPKEYAGSYGNEGFYLNFSDNSSDAALGTDSSGNNNTWTVNNIIGPIADGGTTNVSTVASSGWAISSTVSMVDGNTATSYNALNGGVSFSSSVTAFFKIQHGRGAGGDCWNIFYDSSDNVLYTSPTRAYTAGETFTMGPYYVSGVSKIISASDATGTGSDGHGTGAFYINDAIINTNSDSATSFTYPTSSNTDSFIDSPTNYEAESGNNGGNYATFNSLLYRTSTTFSNGNLQLAAAAYYRSGVATISLDNGKWYYEAEIITDSDNGYSMVGVTTIPESETYPGGGTGDDGFGWYSYTGGLYPSGGTYSTWTVGDVVSVAYDSDTRETWIAKNGVWQNSGDPAAGTGSVFTIGGTKTPYFSTATGINGVITANFGQRPFAYTPPTDFLSLCTQNLSDPTIADGSDYFDATIYTGNNTFPRSITGFGFSPDFVWTKTRSQAYRHMLFDTVRGVGKNLTSNNSDAETTNDDYGYISAFNSDGWTITDGAISGENFNANTDTYVAWAWDAGTSTESNTDGSITAQVRVNASAGFSIVTYTGNQTVGATVGHGLNATPSLLIGKNRDAAESWLCAAKDSSNTWLAGQLNTTTEFYDLLTSTSFRAQAWNNTAPTSSVFELGDDNTRWTNTLNNNQDYVIYCFAPVEGYSAFGSYTGNGDADGPFAYTGFRPRLVLIKRYDSGSTASWQLYDTERAETNVITATLAADTNDTESAFSSGYDIDFVSNGFKPRAGSSNAVNFANGTYFYAAFAEHPFKTARAR